VLSNWYSLANCASGETGRRAGLRIQWGNPWEFKSPLAHHHATQHPGRDPTLPPIVPRVRRHDVCRLVPPGSGFQFQGPETHGEVMLRLLWRIRASSSSRPMPASVLRLVRSRSRTPRLKIIATECRPVSFGDGTSVFWIVPAVYVNGFLGAPTWEECEHLRRRPSADVDRHDRACQIIRLEFAYPDYSEATVFRCRRANSEASRAPQ
jgi:hypothetical protein